MTINQAKQALWDGHKLTHPLFTPDEFICLDENGILRDEAGLHMHNFWDYRDSLAWQRDWKVYEEEKEVENG